MLGIVLSSLADKKLIGEGLGGDFDSAIPHDTGHSSSLLDREPY
jgi:hypothetical protein